MSRTNLGHVVGALIAGVLIFGCASPLRQAIEKADVAGIEAALAQGAGVNDVVNCPFADWTALMCAACYGKEEVVTFLLDRGAEVNRRADTGGSALSAAGMCGHARIVELLLDKGADSDGAILHLENFGYAAEAAMISRVLERRKSAAQSMAPMPSATSGSSSCVVETMAAKPLVLPTDKEEVRLFFLGVSSEQLTADETRALSDLFVGYVRLPPKAIMTTMKDMEAVVGIEKRKDMMGCSDITCMAEIGAALGADVIVAASVGKVGSDLILSLRAINAHTSQAAGSAIVQYSTPACLTKALKEAAAAFKKE